ncbi:MAG TPA: GNAT family N-acetyltransferase [Candidatus Dormibacteraeota bacterium]|jgi:RimJ/RimL family protein N-acetyltransferase
MIEIESGAAGHPGLATLEESDRGLVGRLYQRLSPEAIYRRFFSPVLSPEQFAAALLRRDSRERQAVAAVEQGEVVGVAQYSRAPGSTEAELAIVVADGWQRQGLGTRMVAALADRAVMAGITTFAVDVQGDNQGALRLLRRVAPELRMSFSGGVGEGSFPIAVSR